MRQPQGRARVAIHVGAATVLATWVLALTLLGPLAASAATPGPTSDVGGDTRSAGEGPGLVGSPLLAIGGVLALGCVAAGLTIVYVRATDRTRAKAAGAPAGAPEDDTKPA